MTTDNPWKTLGQHPIYQDPWIRVRVDDVIRPDGSPGTYSVIEFKGGVGVVTLDENDKILLVGQYRYAPNRYSWEIPKGAFSTFDKVKDPLSTIVRELLEETGIGATEWRPLGVVHTLMGSTNDEVHLFAARLKSRRTPTPEATEVINIRWVNMDDFWGMVASGEVSDATSIAAVALASRIQQLPPRTTVP